MSSDFLSDDLDTDEYAALLRGLQWIEGFGVFFVECTPAQAQALIRNLSSELADKKIQTLSLDAEIKDLRECISQIDQSEAIEVLFVTGLEKSFTPYIKEGYGGEGNYYKEDSVPPVLGRLNLDREAFKQAFPQLAIVCILPKFGIKYFIRRAPDFFDWRSGLFCFPESSENPQKIEKETTGFIEKLKRIGCSLIKFVITLIRDLMGARSLYHILMGDSGNSSKNFQKALYYYDLVLRLRPNEHRIWYAKGRVCYELQRYEEAVECYDNALNIKFDYVDRLIFKFRYSIHHKYWSFRGQALSELGRREEALASYEKALDIKPDIYQTWLNRGIVLNALGQQEEALASYDKAIAIKPDIYRAWFNRGIVLNALGQKEEALASYDKGLAIKPDIYRAWFNRGNILDDLGQQEEALASYDKALAIKPDYYLAWFNRGNVLDTLRQKEEALASYDKALAIKPDYYLAWFNRGNVLDTLGQKEEALASYDKALAIKPDYYLAWFNRGIVLNNLGQKEEALASYDKAIAIKPDDYLAWYARGNVLDDLGQKEEALASFDKAIAIKPDEHWAWNNRGNILKDLGQKEEALASYDKALAIKSNYYQAWFNRGLVLKDLGQKEEALASYDKAIATKPDYYQAWSMRGIVLWTQGKLVEAAKSFTTALTIKPDYLSPLGNDIELALVQQDFLRMQQRIDAILPLLKSNEQYFVIVPFLQWLASPTDSPQTVIAAIRQLEANTPIDWDFEDMQPAIARLTPAQQQIAQTFIAFFQNKIDFETLQKQITA